MKQKDARFLKKMRWGVLKNSRSPHLINTMMEYANESRKINKYVIRSIILEFFEKRDRRNSLS
ncbi:hypothetical protein D3C72_338620 [compost metagenome]